MSTHPAPTQSTRTADPPPAAPAATRPAVPAVPAATAVPVDRIAVIVLAHRDLLLRVHAHRLRRADLEDCFSQAALELLARALAGAQFVSAGHVTHALEQKLLSRVTDRRRALSGRSALEAALERAPSTDEPEGEVSRLADRHAGPEELVARRAEIARIREVAHELTPDQRRWLALHEVLGMGCAEFCRRHGWTAEKFRKVGQRARRRLALLLDEYATGERCRRLEPDLLTLAARPAAPIPVERAMPVRRHVANCTSCRARLAQAIGDRPGAAVPAAVAGSDQQPDLPMTPSNPHRCVRRDAGNRPRGSLAVPVAVRAGRSGDLAALRPVAHVPQSAASSAGGGT